MAANSWRRAGEQRCKPREPRGAGEQRAAGERVRAALEQRGASDRSTAEWRISLGTGTTVAPYAGMKRIVDALELLTAQHEAIAVQLAKIPTVELSRLDRAIGELADQVTTHLAIEEQFLAMLGISIPVSDHDELRVTLAELLAMELTSPEVRTCTAGFAARWSAHATSQEATFISLAEIVTPDVLGGIGVQLAKWSEQSRCLAA